MKRKIALLLVIVMMMSMALWLSSCDPKEEPPAEPPIVYDEEPTINGVLLSQFTIVYDESGFDYNKRAAEYIKERAAARFGIELNIVDDDTAKAKNEIVVGETSRGISKALDADCEGLEFAILASEGSVALEGELFIIAAAAFYFMETYTSGSGYEANVPEEISVHEPIVREAKNYILLIGDGMGEYQTKLFDYMENNCEYGDGEDLFYGYMLPYAGWSRTASLSGITDSAAGGTALACGYKTYNEYVGLDENKNQIQSLTELASEMGKSTAVMSTEKKTGATPSTFSAHIENRDSTSAITAAQMETIKKYGTVIDCGYDYYLADRVTLVEDHIKNTLKTLSKDEDGFFLMYEEAHIDKHCHSFDIDKTLQALIRFNVAIGRFMEFAFYNPDTFIIITADHETGGLLPDENGQLVYTADYHTLADVPVFAYGCGAELFDGITVENIQIAHTIAALMGEDNFGDQSVYKSLAKSN